MCDLSPEVAGSPDGVCVRVLDYGGHAGARCRGRSAQEVFTCRVAWIHKVDVGINHSREHQQPCGIHLLRAGQHLVCDRGDRAVGDIDVCSVRTACRYDVATDYREIDVHEMSCNSTLPPCMSSWRTSSLWRA